VFFNPDTDLPYGDIKNAFNRACKNAEIKDFHFHDLRHTFASYLVMGGQDITTVKELLGHKTLTMTLRYSHLAPSHKVKAVDLLDSILNEPTIQKVYNLKDKE
jgi:integrase